MLSGIPEITDYTKKEAMCLFFTSQNHRKCFAVIFIYFVSLSEIMLREFQDLLRL